MKSLLSIMFSIASLVAAAQQSDAIKLTFREAVKIGLENNLNLNQQENNLITSRYSKTAALLGFGPTVSINGSAGRNDGNSFNQQKGQVVNGLVDFAGATLSASMPLINGFNTVNLYRQSDNQFDAQLYLVKRTNQDVIRNVANQFLVCLLDQKLVAIQEKNVATQRQQYDQIKEQVAAGSRAEVDLYNQEYQVKNAELLLLRANNTLRNDKTTLAQTLMVDPIASFELVEPDWDVNTVTSEEITLEQLNEQAQEQRSDLAQATATEKATHFGFQAARGSYYPNVSLFANFGSRYNYIQGVPGNRTFEQQFLKDNKQLTYGVSFSIPIHGAFQTRTNVVRNKVLHENAKLAHENTRITVKADVLRAYQNYRDALTSYESTTAQREAAERSYALEKERYALGISDIVALTLSTQNYTRAQSDFESARYTLMFQKLLINYATGTLKFEDIP